MGYYTEKSGSKVKHGDGYWFGYQIAKMSDEHLRNAIRKALEICSIERVEPTPLMEEYTLRQRMHEQREAERDAILREQLWPYLQEQLAAALAQHLQQEHPACPAPTVTNLRAICNDAERALALTLNQSPVWPQTRIVSYLKDILKEARKGC